MFIQKRYKELMLTQEKLKELLTYFPDTGKWEWNKKIRSIYYGDAGGINKISAGKNNFNYRRVISIQYKKYYSSRLAWLYMTGSWPKHIIDHKDGNSLNDKWENLREVSKSENNTHRQTRAKYTEIRDRKIMGLQRS